MRIASRLNIRPHFLWLLAGLSLCCGRMPQAPAQIAPDIGANLHAGGSGRFVPERWGMVKGTTSNHSDQYASIQMVVIPPGSSGFQYARTVTLPPKSTLEATWPIWLPRVPAGTLDLEYLVFPGGEDKGVIHRQRGETVLATFSSLVQSGASGVTAWLSETETPFEEAGHVQNMIRSMRHTAHHDQAIVILQLRELSRIPENLDTVDQLAVSCETLADHPEVCEAIRLWLQRGGRLLLFLDRTGPEAAELLLGDALPLTVAGETSTNSLRLQLNPEYRSDSYPVREVPREFDEPVRYLRVVADAGEPIWHVDGWPVALRVPVGHGTAIVTTISAEAFCIPRERTTEKEPTHDLIPSMRRFHETFFAPRPAKLLQERQIAEQTAARIGYQIPARSFASVLTLAFPVGLLLAGFWLLKREHGERLIWVLPVLALAAALPAFAKGMAIRAVAPTTVVQTQIVQAVSGSPQLVSDGIATIYCPDPMVLPAAGREGAICEVPADASSLDIRRIVWTGNHQNEWQNLKEPAGINTIRLRQVRRFSSPLEARATFDADGLIGRLATAELTNPRDAVLAGATPDRMAVRILPDGQFRCRPTDLLMSEQFFLDSLLSDEQRLHAGVFVSVLTNHSGTDRFPEQPSVLYWADVADSAVTLGDDATRQLESLLVVQPLRLEAPALNQTVTIPAGLISCRAVADEFGSFSSVFNNTLRTWDPAGREAAGRVRMQFDIPPVCLPFETQEAQLNLRIRAGSRTVRLRMGTNNELEEVRTLTSPVGVFDFAIPSRFISDTRRSGRIFLDLEVSELEAAGDAAGVAGEQDDSWVIERLLLTLKGQRVAADGSR